MQTFDKEIKITWKEVFCQNKSNQKKKLIFQFVLLFSRLLKKGKIFSVPYFIRKLSRPKEAYKKISS